MITGRLLQGDDILRAKKFLYEVYNNELNWTPHLDNPSGWVVREDGPEAYYQDNFDTVAEWFGAYDGDELVAVLRFLRPLEQRLEVEHYHPIPTDLKKNATVAELNRLAIPRRWQESVAMVVLLQSVIEHLLDQGIDSLFLTAAMPSPADFCEKIGFGHVDRRKGFKYSPSDPHPVYLMHLDCRDKSKLEGILALCKNIQAS